MRGHILLACAIGPERFIQVVAPVASLTTTYFTGRGGSPPALGYSNGYVKE